MIAEACVEAGPQGDLGRDRGAHGASSNFVGEAFMEHIEFLVGPSSSTPCADRSA